MAKEKVPELSRKCKDLTDQKFGRLTAIVPMEERKHRCVVWRCLCVCGKESFVSSNALISGHTQSCGCLRLDRHRQAITTHGMSNTFEYHAWEAMIQRCENSNHPNYKHYGNRGIDICERWHKFENFYADMGSRPEGLTLERIDNGKGYNPKNCKWATWKDQQNNQRPASCGPSKRYWFRAWHKDMMCQFMSNNQSEFAKKWGLSVGDISMCIHGKRKTHKGWTFQRTGV